MNIDSIMHIKSIDDARISATIDGDVNLLDYFLSDDLVYTHSNGNCEDKREYIAKIACGDYSYRQMTCSVRHAFTDGTWAILQGEVDVVALADGVEIQRVTAFTMIWTRTDRWRLSAWAATAKAGN